MQTSTLPATSALERRSEDELTIHEVPDVSCNLVHPLRVGRSTTPDTLAITRLAKKLSILDLARMVGHRDLRQLQVYYNERPEDMATRLD